MLSAINPKSGGIQVLPTYALAICIPMIAWEFSFPKLAGVEWIMEGYTGPEPIPATMRPASGVMIVFVGSAISITPVNIVTTPILIIVLSPNLSVIKPHTRRPKVIPR